jgi:uncharacterized protein
MRPESLQVVQRLYAAIGSRDRTELLAALAPDFRGVACDGLPNGLGGTYEGAQSMLRDCWGRVFASFDIRPVPEEYLTVGPDRVVVIGRYLGTVRGTGRPLSAAFAHLLRVGDGRVTELVQITDTAQWHEALG